jgi:general secretion pathway protein D
MTQLINVVRTGIFACFCMIGTSVSFAVDLQPLESQVSRSAPKPAAKPESRPGPKPAANIKKKPPAQKMKKPPRKRIKGGMLFNFQDADVKAVIKTISQITGKNFVLDPRVKGKISIISAKPVSKTAAYQIFLSALKAQGFTTAKVNRDTLKIIPVGEGKQNAALPGQDFSRGGEQMISQVIVIQHGTATQLVPLLRPLMAPTSQLSAYAPANALIITDYADNLRRILKLVEEIDQPVSTDVTIIPLEHASALDMADLISRLTSSRPGGVGGAAKAMAAAGRTSIVPDLRTNSLLVRSDNPGRVAQIKLLVGKLDVPAKTDGNTRVIYLRNADATKLAEILRGLLEASTRQAKRGAKGAASRTGASTTQRSLIQADEATNALIISASDAVYNNLRGVIDKLDTRRAQVFVEALIIEITSKNALALGFQWAGGFGAGDSSVGAISNFPNAPSIAGVAQDPTTLSAVGGLSVAYIGPDIKLPNGDVVQGLGGLARALEDQEMGNVLSTPNILTLDNAEAKISVGQNVPFLTGSFTTASTGASNPFQTIERKDVGLTLQIKPQITEGGTIKLEIMTEVSSVSRTSVAGAQDLVTNKRTLETTVVVDDGSSIVLGGLIENLTEEITQQVPFLGRIPLLGWLFKYKQKEKKKTNLMVFLRPTIIRNSTESLSITRDRYDYIVGQQKKIHARKSKKQLLDKFSPDTNSAFESRNQGILPGAKTKDDNPVTKNSELLGPPDIPVDGPEPDAPESTAPGQSEKD